MNEIGIFEAKTKFPGLCDQVVRSGTPVLVRRRGHPLVVISPADSGSAGLRGGILDDWMAWRTHHPEEGSDDFPAVWEMRQDRETSPLEE